jgi:hypothetical protein
MVVRSPVAVAVRWAGLAHRFLAQECPHPAVDPAEAAPDFGSSARSAPWPLSARSAVAARAEAGSGTDWAGPASGDGGHAGDGGDGAAGALGAASLVVAVAACGTGSSVEGSLRWAAALVGTDWAVRSRTVARATKRHCRWEAALGGPGAGSGLCFHGSAATVSDVMRSGTRPHAYIVSAKDMAQRDGVVRHDPASVDQAHALRSRPRGHGILYAIPQLLDGDGSGEVGEVDAAFDLGGRREDLQVDCGRLFGHIGSAARQLAARQRVVVEVSGWPTWLYTLRLWF